MADTLQFASKREAGVALQNWQRALDFHPEWAKQYLKDHGNPLVPWPGPKEAVGSFNLAFNTSFGGENLPNVIEAKQLEGMMAAFDAHIAESRAVHEEAILKSQKYLELLKKQVARNGGNPDAVVDPAKDPAILQKVDARAQEPIARVLSGDIPAEQKLEYFNKIAAPTTIPEVEVVNEQLGKASLLLTALSAPAPKDSTASFKDIAVTAPQGGVAPILDVVIAPSVRVDAINRVLIDSSQNIINKAGENLVRQPWFERFQRDSHQIMAQGSSRSGAGTIVGDVVGSVFRGAPDETFETFRELYRINAMQDRPATGSSPRRAVPQLKLDINKFRMAKVMNTLRDAPGEVVVAYVEYYRVSLAQGVPPLGFSQFRRTSAGAGSSLVRAGLDVAIKKTGGGLVRWAGTRLGLIAAEGVAGPIGWASLILQAGVSIIKRIGGWLKGLTGIKQGMVPGDKELFGVGCGAILLVFFVLPFISQLNIDSALVEHLPMGGGNTQNGMGPGSNDNAPGGGGTVVGPIVQTAPISGPLTCFNTSVSHGPLSNGQVGILSSTLKSSDARSFGLYNCILDCPQNQIDLHAGGQSGWFGWATPGQITFYNGLFATNNHDRARNVAHELAHEWAYTNPNVTDQFQQEGYCGKLCTYPSGYLGKCSPQETIDETFAEAAAMYLVGENLRSLCPRGYDFMNRMFSTCGGKQ